MGQLIVRRLVSLVFVILGITFLTFIVGYLAPGDPIRVMMGPRRDEQIYANLRHLYGLDQPWHVQYVKYVVVSATLDVAGVIVNESVLSLLGLGIQPPDPSIGQMIRQAIDYLETNWSQVFFPSLVLTALVLSFSFVGDGLRDAFDPQVYHRSRR